jgi:hypothetical protein
MSMAAGGGASPPPTAASQVREMISRGYATKTQAGAGDAYLVFEFLGGVYDGVKMRLYPPFVRRLVLGPETYVWSPPKNGRSPKLTYRLED